MSIFAPLDEVCGIYAPQLGTDTRQVVSFARAAHLVRQDCPVQTSGGEVLTSWMPIGAWPYDVHPNPAGYTRMVQGILVKIDVSLFNGPGKGVVQEGDRAYVDGRQIEVVSVLLGPELECRHIGR